MAHPDDPTLAGHSPAQPCATRPPSASQSSPAWPPARQPGAGTAIPATAALRDRHRDRVLGNQLSLAADWGQPCLAYQLCIRPGVAAQAGLAAVQDAVAGPEPSLLPVPPHALHFSVAWLLGVHEEFGRPKDELWAQYGPGWLATLRTALAPLPPFTLRVSELAATDTAVIGVADAPNPVAALRAELAGTLLRPLNLPLSRGEFVHTTLFRYRAALAAPQAFLERVTSAALNVQVTVHDMLLIREVVFPSLAFQTVHSFTLAPSNQALPQRP